MNHESPENKKKLGRPKGPEKVYFRRYVTPAMASMLKSFVDGDAHAVAPKPFYPDIGVSVLKADCKDLPKMDPNPPKSLDEMVERTEVSLSTSVHIKALMDDVERLENEKKALEQRLIKCSEATDDQKARWWMMKYRELEAKMKKGEFDQT